MWQKQYNRFPNLKANLPLFLRLEYRSDSLICMCVYLKLIPITLQNSDQHNYIAKLVILNTFLTFVNTMLLLILFVMLVCIRHTWKSAFAVCAERCEINVLMMMLMLYDT